MLRRSVLLPLLTLILVFGLLGEARIMTDCEVAKELIRGNVDRSFLRQYICLMKYESHFETKLIQHGRGASMKYGIFQISSDYWCSVGNTGGRCKKRCEDFLNEDIQDDFKCARQIAESQGFKYWPQWLKYCKGRTIDLPNISHCSDKARNSKLTQNYNITLQMV